MSWTSQGSYQSSEDLSWAWLSTAGLLQTLFGAFVSLYDGWDFLDRMPTSQGILTGWTAGRRLYLGRRVKSKHSKSIEDELDRK
jgi:hypothetical protein